MKKKLIMFILTGQIIYLNRGKLIITTRLSFNEFFN